MQKSEYDNLITIATDNKPFTARVRLQEYLKTVTVGEDTDEKLKRPRTLTQNAAMWLEHQLVADKLIERGVSMRKIFESTQDFDIPPTKDNVHDLWLYFQRIMYPSMPSTKDLPKHGDHYQKIHDVMMKNLGEKWQIDYVDFPSDKNKPTTLDNIQQAKSATYYNDNYEEPTI